MSSDEFNTVMMHDCLNRMGAGDQQAREELCQAIAQRMEHLARKMKRGFPRLNPVVDTVDVVQDACIRLLRALRTIHPCSTREFMGLAAEQIRRQLLDLARKHKNAPVPLRPAGDTSMSQADPAAPAEDNSELERWTDFHEKVALLPAEQREVVNLVFYHGWTQVQVAELFQKDERTIRRWWKDALLQLRQLMGEQAEER